MLVFLEYASRQFSFVTILQTGRLGGGLVAGYHSQPRFQLANPLFFAVAVGLLLEARVAVLILPPFDASILSKLVQSQHRVKGYWMCTIFHFAVARNVEHPFLRPPTMYNPVVYAAKYALQSERDCIA